MGAIIAIGIKGKDGKYYNYTISIYDTPDQYNNNVAMWVEQTPEERQMKQTKQYVGNGKVIWTDEKIVLAPRKQTTVNSQIEPPIPVQGFQHQQNGIYNQPKPTEQISPVINNQIKNEDEFLQMNDDDLPF